MLHHFFFFSSSSQSCGLEWKALVQEIKVLTVAFLFATRHTINLDIIQNHAKTYPLHV